MDVFEEFKQLIAEFATFLRQELTLRTAVILGSSLTALIIGLIVIHKMSSKEYVSRRVKKAQAMGHVLTANLIKSWTMTDERLDVNAKVNAVYEYWHDGQAYRYHYLERKVPPKTIQLYYLNNPRHAFLQKNRSYLRGIAVLVLTFLAGAAAAYLTK